MFQLWVRFGSVACGGRGCCDIVQLAFSFDAVMCGMIWFSFGSALVQLVVGIGSLDQMWIILGLAGCGLSFYS